MSVLTSIMRTIYHGVTGKLIFPKKYIGKPVEMEDGRKFTIFRHMKVKRKKMDSNGAIFIIRFKFKSSNHKSNIRKSRIPIPMIAGSPGFRDKLWMIDWETGYWQGMYQFDNVAAIEQYKKSFVLGLMNKRADMSTLSYRTLPDTDIEEYLKTVFKEYQSVIYNAQMASLGVPTS
jgi:hypothetical protein